VRSEDYGRDVLANRRRKTVPELTADPGLVVEDPVTGFCGAVVRFEYGNVVLEDRHGREKLFALRPAGFLVDAVHHGEGPGAVGVRVGEGRGAAGAHRP
jgi:hypothetical protein